MAIRRIKLEGFRNLKDQQLELHSKLNLISGNNGAGKTSFLEALHIICQGRSFKTQYINECINHDHDRLVVFGQFDSHKAGFLRQGNKTLIRKDNQNVQKLSALAEMSPVRILNSNTFELVSSKPTVKREFMDWYLFHVEHQFQQHWLNYTHALKQRNALLKQKGDDSLIEYWDSHLVSASNPIHRMRAAFVDEISNRVIGKKDSLISDTEVRIVYSAGWDCKKDLMEVYRDSREKDKRYGFTQHGLHRDNINIQTCGKAASQVLSRGQQKRLAINLMLNQIQMLQDNTKKSVILLIDDLASELDKSSIKAVMRHLEGMKLQLFLTAIEKDFHSLSATQDYKMFHVEHGMIAPV